MELKSFVIELTADGSPTLRLKNGEAMHHSGGAALETLYIYTKPFKTVFTLRKKLNIGVVGLGLGYIELSILQYLAKQNEKSADVNLVSFEKEAELNFEIKNWLSQKKTHMPYDLILEKLAEKSEIKLDTEEFFKFASEINWQRENELTPEAQVENLFNGLFNYVAYDAFSQYTNGPLWTDEFLDFFLANLCDKDCVFSTYACTGLLKRALQRNDFLFIKREGFSGKRDATLALRGEFISHQHLFQNV